MSKIQIDELTAISKFGTLNTEETANVVGGSYQVYIPVLSYSFVANYSSKAASLSQVNLNSNAQVALGGGHFFTSNGNSSQSSQVNQVSLSQS